MVGDTALTLKKSFETGENVNLKDAQQLLAQSELIGKLLTDPKQKPNTFVGLRAYEWRLLELAEIPFTDSLEKVQKWLTLLLDQSDIAEGFSLTGDKDGLLACHNALITTILIKLQWPDKAKIDQGINWILEYQNLERGQACHWTGQDLFTRFGGCMKKTPCFYGVVKSLNALTAYKKRFGGFERLESKLQQGLEYILKHQGFKRLSTAKPIEASMLENFYPYTYKSNLIEVLALLKANGLLQEARCQEAIEILKQKQTVDGFWQADTSYMKTAWVDFDEPKKPGLWISYIIRGLVAAAPDEMR